MKPDEVLELLGEKGSEVLESYVLVREIRCFLDVGSARFNPELGIKIWLSKVLNGEPYSFSVSHNVHSPEQGAPYYPSHTSAESESEAIRSAISTTTSFIKHAMHAGHKPDDSWMVPNPDF